MKVEQREEGETATEGDEEKAEESKIEESKGDQAEEPASPEKEDKEEDKSIEQAKEETETKDEEDPSQDVKSTEEKSEEEPEVEQSEEKDAPEPEPESESESEPKPSQSEEEDTSEEKSEEIEPTLEEETKKDKPSSETILVPTCVINFRFEYISSSKDQRDELYDMLNKASKKKAMAINKLRESAKAINRAKVAEASTGGVMTTASGGGAASQRSAAVRAGFLNKKDGKKKEPMALVRWYQKVFGPQSILRAVYPIAKNYVLFFGAVALMHFQGHNLALAPPV